MLAARLHWKKGVREFVSAAEAIKRQKIDARFVLVGDPDPNNPTSVPESMLEKWHNDGVIEWWGRRTEMAKVLSQATIICLPSTYREGVPKVLIEAASCCRPIVTTDIAGCRDIVQDGENGILVPPAILRRWSRRSASYWAIAACRNKWANAGGKLLLNGFQRSMSSRRHRQLTSNWFRTARH